MCRPPLLKNKHPVLATYCHVTNYPKIWWLKTTFLISLCSVGQAPGHGFAESSASGSHKGCKVLAGAPAHIKAQSEEDLLPGAFM